MSDTRATAAAQQAEATTAMPSLVPAILEAERVVREAIRHFDLTVRPTCLVVSIQSDRLRSGWFYPERWLNAAGTVLHELALVAEFFETNHPGEVLLHELAHAENHVLGVKDCAGPRHNKKFRDMAARLGLIVDEHPHKRLGFARTELGPGAKAFLAHIGFDAEAFKLVRVQEEPPQRYRARYWWECACGVRLPHKRAGFVATCDECGEPFIMQVDPVCDPFGFGPEFA